MVRLNLSSDDVRNRKEEHSLKKGILNSAHKQGHLFEKSKETNKVRASKTCKSARTGSKTRTGN